MTQILVGCWNFEDIKWTSSKALPYLVHEFTNRSNLNVFLSFKRRRIFCLDSNLFAGQEEEQKFVVLEFGNGGSDLEHVELKNAAQGLAVFYQVAHALAGQCEIQI